MVKGKTLQDVLARKALEPNSDRWEMVDSFRELRKFVEELSAHLSRDVAGVKHLPLNEETEESKE